MAELTGFKKRGHEVFLIAPAHSKIYERAQAADISVVPMRVLRKEMPLSIPQVALWLRKNRVDILNTHSSRDGWICGTAGRLARVPFIIRTRHIDVSYPNSWLSRHAYVTLADHVMTTSKKITGHFEELFRVPADHLSTVPTGIDLNLFKPDGEKAKLIPQENVDIIGMICVVRGWKGHTTFLEAAQLLKQSGFPARFVIVGLNSDHPNIQAQIDNLGLKDYAFGLGHQDDIPAVLRALKVLVIPSTAHEGVPQIGLQAMASKIPVVGSDGGGTPEVIRHGQTGRIFPAKDAAALAAAIKETLAEMETTRRYVEQGFQDAQQKHSLDHMLDTLETLYRRHLPS